MVCSEPQPAARASTRAYTRKRAPPSPSPPRPDRIGGLPPSARVSSSNTGLSAITTAPTGTLRKKIHCQPTVSVSTPPTSRPIVPPEAPTAPQMPSALLRSAPSGKVVIRIESAAGVIDAAPIPCSARAAINIAPDGASPPSSDASANTATPATKTRRLPSRSAALPPSNNRPPKVNAYALTTHCRSFGENSRSAWIEGSATFTIATSRMTMKKAEQSSARPNQWRALALRMGSIEVLPFPSAVVTAKETWRHLHFD